MAVGVSKVVEHLTSKLNALSSNTILPLPPKKEFKDDHR
jgi:hypothetical protein